MIESLCEEAGQLIYKHEETKFHQFPTLEALLKVNEDRFRELGFGYRAKYIVASAEYVQEKGISWLYQLRTQPRDQVQKDLIELKGVGKKVADCVALFSLDQLDVIPVDTHVWQISQSLIPKLKSKKLNPETYSQIGDYFRTTYGDKCGWAHTILFAADLAFFKKSSTYSQQEDDFNDEDQQETNEENSKEETSASKRDSPKEKAKKNTKKTKKS
jgi:N-glycosylase/DNA lyase